MGQGLAGGQGGGEFHLVPLVNPSQVDMHLHTKADAAYQLLQALMSSNNDGLTD